MNIAKGLQNPSRTLLQMQIQLQNHSIILDSKQIKIYQELQILARFLEKYFSKKPTLLKKAVAKIKFLRKRKKMPKSLYIHGDVGRGKSMLVKKFFHDLKIKKKTYFHFNAFMKEVHLHLHQIRKEKVKYRDELIEAVKRIIQKNKIICLDEFQVVDIADAMLLGRIFSYFFTHNILVIFTSNSKPQELYKNGLQREVFLEFINNVLIPHCKVLNLDSATDYRTLYAKNLHQLFFLNNKENNQKIKEIIGVFTKETKLESRFLKLWGREIIIKKTYQNIAIFDFKELCAQNYGSLDYSEICKNFTLIFLLNIPQLTNEELNEIRRFILFIDEAYENQVAMIISAKVEIKNLYPEKKIDDAFNRTISRLNEISSDFYWQNSEFNKSSLRVI